MDKEKILEMSKRDNAGKDPLILDVQTKGDELAGFAVLLLCIIFKTLEYVMLKRKSFGYDCLFSSYLAVTFAYRAFRLNDKKYKIFAAVWSISAVTALVMFIVTIVGKTGG